MASAPPPVLRVSTGTTPEDYQEMRFTSRFRIGRAEDCEFRVQNSFVSRYQAEVLFENDVWRVRDLGSSNGIFVGPERIPEASILLALTIRLGIEGPLISFAVEQLQSAPGSTTRSLDSTALYAARYFDQSASGEPVGEHTQMIRRAFQQVKKKETRKYKGALVALGLAVAAIGGYAYYQHIHIAQQTTTAKEIFYTMKSLQVDLANVENLVRDSQSKQGADQVKKYQIRQKEMERSYDRFLTSLPMLRTATFLAGFRPRER